MNKKSILYIFVVLMALSLTLSAVSADDAVANDVVAAEEAPVVEEAPVAEEVAAGGDELVTEANTTPSGVPIADLETDVTVEEETPYEIIWGVNVINNGPAVAEDVLVFVNGGDNLLPIAYSIPEGTQFNPETYTWYIPILAVNETATLFLDTVKVDEGPYFVEAIAVALGSVDPDLSNNYDIEWADVPEVSAAEETMPAAGNPIAMALLALIAIAGTTISRRF
jgi:hypothetical protein